MTRLFSSKIKFLEIFQIEPWSGEIHQGNLEVPETGNWPQLNNWFDFLKLYFLLFISKIFH